MRAFSLIFVFGPWARPQLERTNDFDRLVIGWFAFWILHHDYEVLLDTWHGVIKKNEALEEELERVKAERSSN